MKLVRRCIPLTMPWLMVLYLVFGLKFPMSVIDKCECALCRHRKWKLTRGEESDTDSGGESGGEVSAQFLYIAIW